MIDEFILKKNIFGGFDRRQVIDCITHLQAKYSENDSRNEIEKTEQHILSLRSEIEERNKIIEQLSQELETLNSLIDSPADDVLTTIKKADIIVSDAKKKAENYINKANKDASESRDKFSALILKVKKLNNELTEIGSNAEKISSRLNTVNTLNEDNIFKAEPKADDCTIATSETEEEIFEEFEEISLPCTEDDYTNANDDSFNYIDNFFAELEKLS